MFVGVLNDCGISDKEFFVSSNSGIRSSMPGVLMLSSNNKEKRCEFLCVFDTRFSRNTIVSYHLPSSLSSFLSLRIMRFGGGGFLRGVGVPRF